MIDPDGQGVGDDPIEVVCEAEDDNGGDGEILFAVWCLRFFLVRWFIWSEILGLGELIFVGVVIMNSSRFSASSK